MSSRRSTHGPRESLASNAGAANRSEGATIIRESHRRWMHVAVTVRAALCVYLAFSVPFRLAFEPDFEVGPDHPGFVALDLLATLFFSWETVGLLRRTPGGTVVPAPEDLGGSQRHVVAVGRHIRISWAFAYSFAAALPLEYIGLVLGGNFASNYLMLNRILRLTYLPHYLGDISAMLEDRGVLKNIGLHRAWKLFFAMAIAGHWCGCGFFLVARIQALQGNNVTWPQEIGLYRVDQLIGAHHVDMLKKPSEAYVISLYWAYITMVTTGFGDIVPLSIPETVWCILSMFIGVVITCCAIANLQLLVTNMDAALTEFQRNMEQTKKYIRYRQLTSDLGHRIISFYEYSWDLLKGADEEKFISELPGSLQQQVANFMCRDLISTLPVLRKANNALLNAVSDCAEINIYSPNDDILKKGEAVRGALLVSRGELIVLNENSVERKMQRFDRFAEESLFVKHKSEKRVRSKTFAEVFIIPAVAFQEIIHAQCDSSHIAKMKETSLALAKNSVKANKMFGSAVDVVPLRGFNRHCHPDSAFRKVWDCILLLGLVYYTFTIPLNVMKSVRHNTFSDNAPVLVMGYAVDCLFLVDVVFNFNFFMYTQEGLVVFDREQIRQNYCENHNVFLELIGALPVDLLVIAPFGTVHSNLFRLTKVVRIPSIIVYVQRVEKVLAEFRIGVDQSLGRVLKLNFLMIVVCHWVGCLWYTCADISEVIGLNDNWRDADELDESLSIDHSDLGGFNAYLRAVYWAIVGMSTIGYGDIIPTNILETAFALTCVLFGGLVLPAVVGGLAAHMGNLNLAVRLHRKKLAMIRRYMRKAGLDASLVDKTMRYYGYLFSRQGGVDEEAIVDELPGPLRQRVAMHVNGSSIDAVPFFNMCDDMMKQMIVSVLKPRVFLPGDIITQEGELATEMFLIERGRVVVSSPDGRIPFCTLGKGEYFGESCLLGTTARVTCVKAMTYCDCFVLGKDDFNAAMATFIPPRRHSITNAVEDAIHRKRRSHSSICRNINEHPKCHKRTPSDVSTVGLVAPTNAVKFHPDSAFRRNWNVVVLFVFAYNAWAIPYRLAFESSPSSYIVDWVLDLILVVDMYLNYREFSFVRGGDLVTDRKEVKRGYVSGNLRIDAFSTVPLDLVALLILYDHQDLAFSLAALRIPRLLRLTRLLTIMGDVFRAIEDTNLKKAPIQLVQFLSGVVLIAHWAACGFFALARWKNDQGQCVGLDQSEVIIDWANEYTECRWADTWIQRQIINGKVPTDGGDMWQLYLRSFNWALPTLVVVVIGDVVPVNSAETLYAFLWMVIGVTINAAIVGNVANIVANLDNDLAEFVERADQIKSFMHYHHLCHDLQDRVENFLAYLWATHSGTASEDGFVEELPYTLQVAVTEHTRMGLFRDCPFFDFCSTDIIKSLALCLKPLIFSVGDVLAHENDMGQEMFFLESGSVEVVSGDGKTVFATLSNKGCFFGETSVFFKTKRQNTLRAATFCEVFQLDKCDLVEVLKQRDFDPSRMLAVFTDIANSNRKRNAAVKANLEASKLQHTKLHKIIQLGSAQAPGKRPRRIFLPNSSFRATWDIMSLICAVYYSLSIPYRMAFFLEDSMWSIARWLVLDGCIDIFFIVDVYLRCSRFAFIQDGATVADRGSIRHQYWNKGMFLDAISCLPLELLVAFIGLPYVFFLRIGHLVRVRRLSGYMHKIEGYLAMWNIHFSAASILLLKMFFFYLLVNHWCTCIWFIIHRYIERGVQYTWATTDCVEGGVLAEEGCLSRWDEAAGEHDICSGPVSTCYIRSLHFVITTMSSVGYGDITPVTELETIWQNVVVLIAACFVAGIIGAFTAYLSHNDTSGLNAFKLKMHKLQEYMKYRKLPSQLQNDILTFHRHRWEQSHVLDQQAIMSILPLPLQRELSYEVLKHVIYQVPILDSRTKIVQERVAHALHLQFCPPQSDIYHVGDIGWDIFFIGKGICRISLPSNLSDLDSAGRAHLERLRQKAESVGLLYRIGNHFGESVLTSISGVRQETVTAETAAELYSLSKDDLEHIWSYMAPDDRQRFKNDLLMRNGNVWHSFDEEDVTKSDSTARPPQLSYISNRRSMFVGCRKSHRFNAISPSQRRRKKSNTLELQRLVQSGNLGVEEADDDSSSSSSSDSSSSRENSATEEAQHNERIHCPRQVWDPGSGTG